MASKFQRRQNWWIKFRHPATGELIRESLETTDEARAELLRQRLDLEVALREPRFQAAEIPARVREVLGNVALVGVPAGLPVSSIQRVQVPPAPVLPVPKRTTVDEAVAAYLRFIKTENAKLHVANKVSIFRRFIGAERLEKAGGPVKTKRRRQEGGGHVPDPEPFFTGTFLDEITPVLVQNFFESLGVSRKTLRHYREAFHHFFEFCLKFDLYIPTNWHRPNPIAALPSYVTRNKHIVFLSAAEVDDQLARLECDPAMQMAARIMIHAGLRRSETLWLTKDAIASDFSFLSVRYHRDADTDIESTLKTGERTVTILPPLRDALREYVSTLKSQWIVPNKKGARWRPDDFSGRLRTLNQGFGLPWTCLAFRHTYATQRAAEGWSLFRIAKEMGNSVAVVEEYYAGYIRPSSSGSG